MATVGEEPTASESPRFCSECGALSEGRFCVHCGHNTLSAIPAVAPPAPARQPDTSFVDPQPRSRWLVLAAGGAIGVAAIAVAAVILLTGSSSSDSGTVYRHQLTGALAPVLSADTTLASSLQNLSGSDTTAAKNAASQSQTALENAHGAVSVLGVPSGSSQLSQQVGQAVTQLNAYLQAVSATLASPTSQSVSQLQTSATNTQSSLIPVAVAAPGAGQSIASGTQALGSWVSSRAAAQRRAAAAARVAAAKARAKQKQRLATSTTTQTVTSPSSPTVAPAASGGTSCGGGLIAGPNTSCPFAENVRAAWDQAPGNVATVTAYSPVTSQTYTMSCAPAGDGITCSGANDASLSFPS
jgi:hypothetical protein